MPKSYKTTKKHFKIFKRECRYWLDRFNLWSWRVDLHHETFSEDSKGNCAWVEADWQNKTCDISLDIFWGKYKPTKKRVAVSAFHETCELLLYMLSTEAKVDRSPSVEENLISYRHTIIRRLEKAIWEPYWEKK